VAARLQWLVDVKGKSAEAILFRAAVLAPIVMPRRDLLARVLAFFKILF
jgi:hypothetical protein